MFYLIVLINEMLTNQKINIPPISADTDKYEWKDEFFVEIYEAFSFNSI